MRLGRCLGTGRWLRARPVWTWGRSAARRQRGPGSRRWRGRRPTSSSTRRPSIQTEKRNTRRAPNLTQWRSARPARDLFSYFAWLRQVRTAILPLFRPLTMLPEEEECRPARGPVLGAAARASVSCPWSARETRQRRAGGGARQQTAAPVPASGLDRRVAATAGPPADRGGGATSASSSPPSGRAPPHGRSPSVSWA